MKMLPGLGFKFYGNSNLKATVPGTNITTQETTLIIRLCPAELRITLLELDIIGDVLAVKESNYLYLGPPPHNETEESIPENLRNGRDL